MGTGGFETRPYNSPVRTVASPFVLSEAKSKDPKRLGQYDREPGVTNRPYPSGGLRACHPAACS